MVIQAERRFDGVAGGIGWLGVGVSSTLVSVGAGASPIGGDAGRSRQERRFGRDGRESSWVNGILHVDGSNGENVSVQV